MSVLPLCSTPTVFILPQHLVPLSSPLPFFPPSLLSSFNLSLHLALVSERPGEHPSIHSAFIIKMYLFYSWPCAGDELVN